MLSSPPAGVGGVHQRLGGRLDVARRASRTTRAISSSGIMVVRPSEHRSRMSPGCDLVDLHVDLQVGLAAQRARDHVAQGVAAGLVGGDDAALDLLVHPGVVAA